METHGTATASLTEDYHHKPCAQCDGFLEPELAAVHPASDVCLECMPKDQLSRLEEELNQVQRVDRSLLPEPVRVEGWEVGLYYRPSRLLSGDFYDLRVESETRLGILLGDVMGKGIPAALLRTRLLGVLQALSAEIDSPARVLASANRQFLSAASPGRLSSAFRGSIDVVEGELVYANAGHLPPVVRRRSGRWESLEATGMVLGAMETASYEERSVPLEPGDLLALYSDGITEAQSSSGAFFDERAVAEILEGDPEAPVQQLAISVARELERFNPGEPSDDRTLLIVRRS